MSKKDYYKDKAREYYINNKEVMINRSKDYYINNKELMLEYAKNKYKSLTKDKKQKIKHYQKQYRENNPLT